MTKVTKGRRRRVVPIIDPLRPALEQPDKVFWKSLSTNRVWSKPPG